MKENGQKLHGVSSNSLKNNVLFCFCFFCTLISDIIQEKTAVTLLRQRRFYRDNQALQTAIREALALIGYVDPVKGHGIKVLSIDGGGTR